MNEMKMAKRNEMKKLVLGSVGAIAVTTMMFSGINQTIKAAEVGKTEMVPTSYNVSYAEIGSKSVPQDYVKKDYKVKLVGEDKPTVNDMKMNEAAELASQNLWKVFKLDLSGRTVEMTYNPVINETQQRATWEANVKINDMLSYAFQLDAVTGENHLIAKWVYHKAKIRTGMDMNLLKNNEEYQFLAKETVEKYQLLSGKITSVEYSGQGYSENRQGGKNADIFFRVRSDKGEAVQIVFSRHNKELLQVGYDSWMKETERHEKKIEQELKEHNNREVIITDEMRKKIEENGPLLSEIKK